MNRDEIGQLNAEFRSSELAKLQEEIEELQANLERVKEEAKGDAQKLTAATVCVLEWALCTHNDDDLWVTVRVKFPIGSDFPIVKDLVRIMKQEKNDEFEGSVAFRDELKFPTHKQNKCFYDDSDPSLPIVEFHEIHHQFCIRAADYATFYEHIKTSRRPYWISKFNPDPNAERGSGLMFLEE